MKLNKNIKSKTIDLSTRNPFRGTPTPFERKYTVCRITEGNNISIHPSFSVIVDADLERVENFAQNIYSLPEKDRYFCSILELFFVKKKYLPKIKKLARQHFDAVVVEDVTGKVEVIKQYEKN